MDKSESFLSRTVLKLVPVPLCIWCKIPKISTMHLPWIVDAYSVPYPKTDFVLFSLDLLLYNQHLCLLPLCCLWGQNQAACRRRTLKYQVLTKVSKVIFFYKLFGNIVEMSPAKKNSKKENLKYFTNGKQVFCLTNIACCAILGRMKQTRITSSKNALKYLIKNSYVWWYDGMMVWWYKNTHSYLSCI